MTCYRIGAALAVIVTAGTAMAQTTAPEANRVTNGPAGLVETTHSHTVVDGNGTVRRTSQTFRKTQSYSSKDGQLTAHTSMQTTGK